MTARTKIYVHVWNVSKNSSYFTFYLSVQDKPTFKAFIITLVIKITQQFDGYLIVLIYAGFVFERASESISLKLSPNKQVIMIGVVQLVGSILATCIVEKTGRKVSYTRRLHLLIQKPWWISRLHRYSTYAVLKFSKPSKKNIACWILRLHRCYTYYYVILKCRRQILLEIENLLMKIDFGVTLSVKNVVMLSSVFLHCLLSYILWHLFFAYCTNLS